MSERLRRVIVTIPADAADAAGARLLELFPAGFEERETAALVELAVYTDGEGEATLRSVFADVSASDVEPGWEDAWRAFHRPVRAGGLWIGPPWARPPAAGLAVVVDPGRAFGTGAHPTTRACIDLLARLEPGGLLDLGCGSGVLSVAAARLGYAPVVALDSDPVAVEVTRETAALNGVELDARWADVLVAELPLVDVAVANIELRVVERLLPRLRASTAVTSGYLAGVEPVAAGWHVRDALELDGWAAHVLTCAQAH